MIEIKFRAWDKKLSCFIKVSPIPEDGFNHFKDNPESTVNHHLMDLESGISHYLTLSGNFVSLTPESPWRTGIRDESERYILQQFTGRKDKNGKEIYVGDVLKAFRREDDPQKKQPITSEVTFLNGCYMAFNCTFHELYRIWQSDLEVIGNIYENPANYELEQLDEQHRKKVFEELRKVR